MYKQLYSSLCKINLVSIASKKLKMIIEDCFSDQSIVYRWVCHFLKNLISFFSKELNHTIISLTLCKDQVTCEPITYPFLVIKIILHLFFLCIGELKISLYIYMKVKGKKSSELNQCYNKNTLKSHRFWNALFHVQAHFTNIELADAVELSPSCMKHVKRVYIEKYWHDGAIVYRKGGTHTDQTLQLVRCYFANMSMQEEINGAARVHLQNA